MKYALGPYPGPAGVIHSNRCCTVYFMSDVYYSCRLTREASTLLSNEKAHDVTTARSVVIDAVASAVIGCGCSQRWGHGQAIPAAVLPPVGPEGEGRKYGTMKNKNQIRSGGVIQCCMAKSLCVSSQRYVSICGYNLWLGRVLTRGPYPGALTF